MDHYVSAKILKSEWVKVTPAAAAKMLQNNKVNRTLNQRTVEKYASDMRRGAWVVLDDPIALNEEGAVLNGQHRLSAVVVSGKPQMFRVTTYSGCHTALMVPFDKGRGRTTADTMGEPTRRVSVLKNICWAVIRYAPLPDDVMRTLYAIFEPHIAAVEDLHVKSFNVAPVRAAVALRHACGVDWTAQYSAMVHRRYKEMDPITAALYNRLLDGAAAGYGGTAAKVKFALTWHTSSPLRKHQTKFLSSAVADALEEARASFARLAPEVFAQYGPKPGEESTT